MDDDKYFEEDRKPKDLLTKEEKKWFILGALKGGLLIGLAYAVGLGIFIAILYFCFM